MKPRLFIPGPVDVCDDVLESMCKPVIGHREPAISDLLDSLEDGLRKLMYTENTVFTIASSSTGLMEAGVRNLVKKGCLNIVNGAFSDRWSKITVGNGKETDRLEVEWGDAVDSKVLDEKLSTGEYDAVTLVHNETSTGVMTPLDEVAEVLKKYDDILLLVDTVSSLAGVKVEVDKLDIDFCLSGTQKCFAVPPGLAMCSVSERAFERANEVEDRGYYFDLLVHKKYWSKERKQTPSTPAISLMYALDYQLQKILEKEGLENRFKRHREMAEYTRDWAVGKGFEMYPKRKEIMSDTVSCMSNNLDHDLKELSSKLRDRGYVFSNGYGKLKGKAFRVAHMGDRQPEDLKTYLQAIEEILGL